MMTLEEAIKHCKDVALSCTNKECALEHFQLLKWLQEYSNMLEKQGEQKHKIQPKFKIGDIIRFKGNETLKGEAETHKIVSYDNELYIFADGTTDLFCEQDLYELVEQKPADKVEPKFHKGDWITNGIDFTFQIHSIENNMYLRSDDYFIDIETADKKFRLWTIQDAKDGDVLYINNTMSESIMIYKSSNNGIINKYASYNKFGFEGENYLTLNDGYIIPATKEQRDLLFSNMREAGYEWDADKKELKKIEQKYTPIEQNVDNKKLQDIVIEEINKYGGNESYKAPWAIDSTGLQYPLYFANLGATWQKEQKPAWSEGDEIKINRIVACLENLNVVDNDILLKDINWLKDLKDRVQPQPKQEWKQENIGDLTDFEIAMMHIGNSFFGENAGLDPNNTACVKEQAQLLLDANQKSVWSEEDENKFDMFNIWIQYNLDAPEEEKRELLNWLKSLKDRYTWKPNLLSDIISGCNKEEFSQFEYSLIHFAMACSDENMTPKGIHCYAQTSLNEAKKEIKLTEEDEKTVHLACEFIRHHSNPIDSIGGIDCSTLIERLKSLRPQNGWKPSNRELGAILAAIGDERQKGSDVTKELLNIYQQLKKLREELL